VAAQLREKVLEVSERLGYVPNSVARGMVSRRTGAVGVVVADVTNPFYPQLLQGVNQELAAAGFRTVLITDPVDAPAEVADFERLLDRTLDGVIIATAMTHSSAPALLAARGLPVALVVRRVDGDPVDTVVSDNVRGARDAAELLVARGHREIALLLGPDATSTSAERESGYRGALDRHGIVVPDARRSSGPYSFESGYARALAVLESPDPPTALLCANDVLAIGAVEAVRRLRLRLPDDVSVIGFDDMPMAAWESFRLTTVHQDVPGMARRAARRLLARIRTGSTEPPHVDVFPTDVVERATVADRR
jgi:LacI family transcriptional regulator